MMLLHGVPDFAWSIQGNGFQIFAPYQSVGNYCFVPECLEVAPRANGEPDFLLEMVRGQNPFLPPQPYGVLDFRVQPPDHTVAALALIRPQQPDALVAPPQFTSGFLRLQLISGIEEDIPEALKEPIALTWNGLGVARFIRKLSTDGVSLLKQVLEGAVLPLQAIAEMEMVGVSPRLPVQVEFDPAALLASLAALGDENGRLAWQELVGFFRHDVNTLPLNAVTGLSESDRDLFAESLADRVRTRYGEFVPTPSETVQPYLALSSPDEAGTGRVRWDLSTRHTARRVFVLESNPLAAARAMVDTYGLESVFHETVVPSIATGVVSLAIAANLPPQRQGVLMAGVTVHAPPNLPHRVQALVKSAEFQPPDDTVTIHLRFSPAEDPIYDYTTFVVVHDASGIEELRSEPTLHKGERLLLSVDDFPVVFVPVEATAALLTEATVHGTCRWPAKGDTVTHAFELTTDQPVVTLTLPKAAAAEATLVIEARSMKTEQVLALGPLPAQGLRIGRHSFPEYGPHTVEIECFLDAETPLFAIDLLPECQSETLEAITVLAFTANQPKKSWTWLAETPFLAGYRYRPHVSGDNPPTAWSKVHLPGERLEIHLESGKEVVND